MAFRISFFLLLLCLSPVQSAFAQVDASHGENTKPPPIIMPRDARSIAAYHVMAMTAIRDRPKSFEFGVFRSYYTRTDDYDPIGETTRQKVVGLAYTIQNDPDPAVRKQAFDEYGALVTAHLANVDVVSQAYILAQEDKIFGDPKFFEWMRKGLLRNLVKSGDGSSLVRAYDAMTLGEEAMLMNVLGLKVLKTESANSANIYYNTHLVQGPKSPEPYWMFVDVSRPMAALEQKKAQKKGELKIEKQ